MRNRTPKPKHIPLMKLRSSVTPGSLIPGITAGALTGIIESIVVVSLASLVFAGSLSGYLPRALGLYLAGAALVVAIVGLTSSHPSIFASLQDAPTAIMALAAVQIAANLTGSSQPERIYPTVVVTIGLTTLLIGTCFLIMGRLRLGALVRYLPYPVVGGFLAGTGWVLAIGGIGVMMDANITLANLYSILQPEALAHWLPGLLFAIIFLILLSRSNHSLAFPGVIFGAVAAFYLATTLTGNSIAELSQAGWLMGPFPQGDLWQPPSLSELQATSWSQVFSQAGSIATAVLLSVLALLLNTSGLEMILEKDLNIDQELQSAGYANMAAGIFGSLSGYHAVSSTALLDKIGSRSRLSLLIASLVCVGVLFFGAALLNLMPKLVIGGLILALGLEFIIQWVYKTWYTLPRIDWLIILIILGTIATVGFLEGVAVGTFAAIVMFVVSYSRIHVVKRALTAAEFHSTKTRPRSQRLVLAETGKQIAIIELQGFIFFGTASQILDEIKKYLDGSQERCYLILDFSRVSGIDSSVTFGFNKIKQLTKEKETGLVFTGLSPYLSKQVRKADIIEDMTTAVQLFSRLDEGVEWCENMLLNETESVEIHSITEQLAEIINDQEHIENLMGYLERMELEAGEVLIKEGDAVDGLYLVESGQVTAQLERPGQEPLSLQTVTGENVVGEVGVYGNLPRTANVVVDLPSVVYKLTVEALERMEAESPETAIYTHKLMAFLMAERVGHVTKVAESLK